MTGRERPVVILGALGQLGTAMIREFEGHAPLVALGRGDVDLTDSRQLARRMRDLRPAVVVNCAAYNAVDAAEDEPATALAVNALAVRTLARAADDAGVALVHFSTDFVFDGTASQPYSEDDRPNPQSVYASSKLLGEWFAADAPRAYVLRVESLFGADAIGGPSKGSVAFILRTMLAGGEPAVFADRTVSPTFVVDAAHATRLLLESGAAPGVYHCVNSGACTWVEFAEELAARLRLPVRLARVRMSDLKLRARRPQYCVLSNDRLAAAGVAMPPWRDAVRRYLRDLGHEIAD